MRLEGGKEGSVQGGEREGKKMRKERGARSHTKPLEACKGRRANLAPLARRPSCVCSCWCSGCTVVPSSALPEQLLQGAMGRTELGSPLPLGQRRQSDLFWGGKALLERGFA